MATAMTWICGAWEGGVIDWIFPSMAFPDRGLQAGVDSGLPIFSPAAASHARPRV